MRKISKIIVAFVLFITMISTSIIINTASACDREPYCCFCTPGAVFYLGKDTETQGDWLNAKDSPIGVYGSYAHILPNPPRTRMEIPVGNFSVPTGLFNYTDYCWTSSQISGLPFNRTDPPYWDEYVSLEPRINYTLNGTLQNIVGIGAIQYPVFEWAWDDFNSTDIRAANFTTHTEGGGPGTRLTCWDDGSERDLYYNMTSEGYFNITLTFPDGLFMLSLYAYDMEGWARPNQTIYITDESGEVLASAVMEGTEFDEGVYLQFVVCGPTTIIVQVKRGPESVNALLSGVFVDKVSCKCKWSCCRSKGFWKTNLAKLLGYRRGRPIVSRSDMEEYILFASTRCPAVFGGLTSLEDAYQVFKDYSSSMLSKAKAQLLALLFNVASGRASEYDIVAPYLAYRLRYKYPSLGLSDYPFTLGSVIDTSCSNIISQSNLKFTKNVCEALNQWHYAIILRPS